jgi:hypothetical protein
VRRHADITGSPSAPDIEAAWRPVRPTAEMLVDDSHLNGLMLKQASGTRLMPNDSISAAIAAGQAKRLERTDANAPRRRVSKKRGK